MGTIKIISSVCEGCTYAGTPENQYPCNICMRNPLLTKFAKKTDGTEIRSDAVADYYKTDSKVDHPSHYNADGGIECIEEMILVFGKEAVASFCLCNVWKYRYRAITKGGEQDMKKADWYMAKWVELTGRKV